MKRTLLLLLALVPQLLPAQRQLTLDECRRMAIEQNKDLVQQRTKLEMAGYDRKIAASYYYPKISAIGTYQHLGGGFSLIDDRSIPQFSGIGDRVQASRDALMQQIQGIIAQDPQLAQQLMQNQTWQEIMTRLSSSELATVLNGVGASVDKAIDDAIHPDLDNVFVGAISLQQPIFAGGKIVASNKMARYAEELARLEYDGNYDEALVAVDQAYWQVVSVAAKKKLAGSYSQLLRNMLGNVEISVQEGVATEADALTVRVKSNDADMALTKATNGLRLAKMFLCKQIGLPLDSEISLADEGTEDVPLPQTPEAKSMDQVIADRSETRRLELASAIYDQKVKIAQADMLPQIALTANYIVMNPNMNHGFENEFGSNWSAGVVVNIPIFHGFEALQKTRKAKAEATIYRSKYEDACNLINLQVTQLRQQQVEALERLSTAQANLDVAEENLRTATAGFDAGVIDANTALGAHTAWLKAHSEYIDAGIEVQLNDSLIKKAEGSYVSDLDSEEKKVK